MAAVGLAKLGTSKNSRAANAGVFIPGAHAVLLLDQAGRNLTPKLSIPKNITIMPLPSRAPELNPVENIWQFMRDNWLSNRLFNSHEWAALSYGDATRDHVSASFGSPCRLVS